MSESWRRGLQRAAVCVLFAAYAGLAHYSNATAAHNLGAALALAPPTLTVLILVWRSAPAILAMVLSAGWAALLNCVWPFLTKNFSLFYLIQESSIYGLLGLTFGRSLRSGRVALCTQLADRVHGPLSSCEVRYTRQVTLAWAAFFFAITSVSVALYSMAPLRVWSLYINFCVVPLVTAMFVTEYLVRRRILPQVKRVGIIAAVRAYCSSPQYREHGH